MTISQILNISRPRFWLYLVGPYLVALAVAGVQPSLGVILLGLYLTLPANLLIYGVNDIYDYETDRRNPKKGSYEALVTPESQRKLAVVISMLNLPFLALFAVLPMESWLWLVLFVVTGMGYSAPPIRAKARPVLDMVFNILYVAPGFAAYTALTGSMPAWPVVVAATLWCMAMHAYSAVPDIQADRSSNTPTIATWLGERRTLIFCGLAYLASAALSFSYIGWFSIGAGIVYLSIIVLSLRRYEDLFSLYRKFPLVNTIVGATLFVITLTT